MTEHPRLWKQLLIQQLSQKYHSAQRNLYDKNVRLAREDYIDMIRLYTDIAKTDLDDEDKRVAHFCVKTVYDSLLEKQEEPPLSESTFRIMFSVSIIILLVGLAIVLKPAIVGLTTINIINEPVFIGTQTRFFITEPYTIPLNTMFKNGDNLEYMVTRSPTVDIDILGPRATFIPMGKMGMSRHTIIAVKKVGVDFAVTRVPIEIIVQ